MTFSLRRAAAGVALLLTLGACSSGFRFEGIVVAVDGDLVTVRSFDVRAPDGEVRRFVPDEEATFDGGPLTHIRDHLRSGEPVEVDYVDRDGESLATDVRDAG